MLCTTECTTETEKLFKIHKHAISNAVYEVLMKLDQKKEDGMAAGAGDQIAEASVEGIQQPQRGLNLLAGPQQRVDPLRVQRSDLMKYSCELTLDTNTVNRELKLSDNNRMVTRVEEDQPYPDHPERFDYWPQLLCRDGLTGRCYWEVERTGGRVSIAVSYKGISRRGNSVDYWFGRNDQSWRLWCSDDGYSVWHNNNRTSLPRSASRRVAVYVDCPAGSLSFYTLSSGSLIHLYTFNTTFTEPLYPGFAFGSYGASISLG
ncbi:neoverrucotoxin subunit beta [Perca flavescens]|uniref:neoverrucotoxin subunit beta n=1 Tax=Perca flavescens TaxID=8167 RepID=UPI00106EF5E9|nr:neoverrucotoxin subunit beta-like [Perca flavescens]